MTCPSCGVRGGRDRGRRLRIDLAAARICRAGRAEEHERAEQQQARRRSRRRRSASDSGRRTSAGTSAGAPVGRLAGCPSGSSNPRPWRPRRGRVVLPELAAALLLALVRSPEAPSLDRRTPIRRTRRTRPSTRRPAHARLPGGFRRRSRGASPRTGRAAAASRRRSPGTLAHCVPPEDDGRASRAVGRGRPFRRRPTVRVRSDTCARWAG